MDFKKRGSGKQVAKEEGITALKFMKRAESKQKEELKKESQHVIDEIHQK